MSNAVSTSLDFEKGEDGPVPVLLVAGDLDAASAAPFAAAVGSVIALEHPARMVVDLSGVDFIDSTGLNELVRAHYNLHDVGGCLVLRSPGETARILLDITRLSGHLEIE
jgi:anti-sigma B factor antagonist